MAYNLGILTYPFTKIAADGNGDLQQALGTTLTSQVGIFALPRNKWAKYQPFADSRVFSDRFSDTSSTRLAALKSANWGFGTDGIPTYSTKTTLLSAMSTLAAGSAWTRTALSTLRALDFDGYINESGVSGNGIWGLPYGTANSGKNLKFPFNGSIRLPQTTIGIQYAFDATLQRTPGETLQNYLLHPSDLTSAGGYNLYNWYFGLALVDDEFSDLYILTDQTALSAHTEDSGEIDLSGIRINNSSVVSGSYYLFPILAMNKSASSSAFGSMTSWTSESTLVGRVALIDGYRLPLTVSTTLPALTVTSTVTVNTSGTTTVNVTFANNSGSSVIIAPNTFCYVQAEATADSSTVDYAGALTEAGTAWTANNTRYTDGVTASDGNICAAYVTFGQTASQTIAAGNSLTLTGTISSTSDALGNGYGSGSSVTVCYTISMTRYAV